MDTFQVILEAVLLCDGLLGTFYHTLLASFICVKCTL